jgi:hypothetical protein
MSDDKTTIQSKSPYFRQPQQSEAPAQPPVPPRATLDNAPEVDPLTLEVSPSSGLHRKYPAGPAKPLPES